MKKTIIKLDGVLSKADLGEITEKEADNLIDKILEIVEQKGYLFGGGYSLEEDNEEEKLKNRKNITP